MQFYTNTISTILCSASISRFQYMEILRMNVSHSNVRELQDSIQERNIICFCSFLSYMEDGLGHHCLLMRMLLVFGVQTSYHSLVFNLLRCCVGDYFQSKHKRRKYLMINSTLDKEREEEGCQSWTTTRWRDWDRHEPWMASHTTAMASSLT